LDSYRRGASIAKRLTKVSIPQHIFLNPTHDRPF
jgi:hypothetical protein